MRRLDNLLDRLIAAADDDPLALAAGALVGILAFGVLVLAGLVLAGLVWIALPWSLIALPLLCLGWVIADRGRADPDR
jgi:hypothetical protein